jgi:hypothetical protein
MNASALPRLTDRPAISSMQRSQKDGSPSPSPCPGPATPRRWLPSTPRRAGPGTYRWTSLAKSCNAPSMRTKILAKILSASLPLTSRIGRIPFQELRPARGPDRALRPDFGKRLAPPSVGRGAKGSAAGAKRPERGRGEVGTRKARRDTTMPEQDSAWRVVARSEYRQGRLIECSRP